MYFVTYIFSSVNVCECKCKNPRFLARDLTRFPSQAATAQMAVEKEAVCLSRVHSADNFFQSFTVLWGKGYFLTSNLLCVQSCPLVLLPVFNFDKYIMVYIFLTIQ